MYKVLMIDDEILAIRYLENLVKWEKLDCRIVGKALTVDQSTEIWKKEQPDIVFMDIRMPKSDGLTLSRYFLEKNPSTVIVLLTAYNDFEYARKAVKMGVFDFLIKHELTSELLTDVLCRVKSGVDERKAQRFLQCSNLLQNVWLGRGDEPWRYGRMSVQGKYYLFTVCRLDGQMMPQIDYKEIRCLGERLQHLSMEVHGALPIKEWGICFLLHTTQIEEKEEYPMLFETAEMLAAACGEQNRNYYLTVSDSFSKEKIGRAVAQGRQMAESIPYRAERLISYAQYVSMRKYIPIYSGEYQKKILTLIRTDGSKLYTVLTEPFEQMKPGEYVTREGMEAFAHVINEITERIPQKQKFSPDMGGGIHRILSQLKKQLDMIFESKLDYVTRDKVYAAKQYIENNYYKSPTAEEIADVLQMSEGHLRRIFREETGCTIHNYLIGIKVEAAQKLLREKKYKMYEIAEICGFGSVQYFSQVIRRMTGLTPGELLEEGEKQSDE